MEEEGEGQGTMSHSSHGILACSFAVSHALWLRHASHALVACSFAILPAIWLSHDKS